MYHMHSYPAIRLTPVWERIVTLIERGEYNQARKEMEFLYRDTNRIISILEEMFPPVDSNPQRKPRWKRRKSKGTKDLNDKETFTKK